MGVKILIVNDDMSESEKKEILRLIKKLSSKRRRDRKPRLKHEVGVRNPDSEDQNVRRCRLDYLINNIFLNDEKVKLTYPEKLGHTK